MNNRSSNYSILQLAAIATRPLLAYWRVKKTNLRLDSDAPKAARQARVEGVEKVILCYTDAIKKHF